MPCLLVPWQGQSAALPYQPDASSQRVGTCWRQTRGVLALHRPPHFPKGLPPWGRQPVPRPPACPAWPSSPSPGRDGPQCPVSLTDPLGPSVPASSAALRCIPYVGMTLLALRAVLTQVGSGEVLRAVCSGECRLLGWGPRGRGGLRCLHVISEGMWRA